MNGFRQKQQESRKERLRHMEAELKNSQMAARIGQMMTQQMMQNMQNMQKDLGAAMNLINELQYKVLAVQKLTNLDVSQLGSIADELRLNDFNTASDKEDAAENYTVGTVVDAESVVILTSKTDEPDKGIFRSKLKLSECGVPDLYRAFEGREVGAKAIVKLNNIDHEVELLAIRQPPKAEPVAQEAPVAEADCNFA